MDSGFAVYDADDARLLSLAGAGDAEAFGVLSERHAWAARKLARQLVPPASVEAVVAEAFARVRAVIRRGCGPSNAVRPYMLTALRWVCDERQRGQLTALSPEEQQLTDPGALLIDPAVSGVEQTLAARAYLSVPERWRAMLWHAEIEQEHPLVVTPLFGLARNGIAALNHQAIDGLRQAYVQLYVRAIARPECEPVAERLDAYVRDALPPPDATQVWEHLRGCGECLAAYDELSDIRATLRGTVAPLILGTAADAYLETEAPSASAVAAGPTTLAIRSAARGEVVLRDSAARKQRGRRRARRRMPLSLAVAAAVALVALVGGAIGFTLEDRPSPATGTGTAMGSPPPSPVPGLPAQVVPSTSPSSSPPPSVVPITASSSPQASSASPSTQTLTTLSASMDINQAQFGGPDGGPGSGPPTDEIGFDVMNTGPVATGPLTVAIALPSGSSPTGGQPSSPSPGVTGGIPAGGGAPADGIAGFGWSCEPTDGGITCTHAPVAAGQHVDGRLSITISGFMTCGKPVRLTASSGEATAQAVQDLRC